MNVTKGERERKKTLVDADLEIENAQFHNAYS